MNEQAQQELKLLVDKRWDPIRGVGKLLGTLRYGFMVLFGISIGVGYLTGHSYLYIFFAVPLVLCYVQPAFVHQRMLKRAEQHDWFLCPWCRYALADLPDEGICPECGTRYRRDVCVVLYQSAYQSFKPDPATLRKRESEAWRKAIKLPDGVVDE